MYMSCVAAAGACSLASTTSYVPFGVLIIMKPPPPIPLDSGFATPWHSATACSSIQLGQFAWVNSLGSGKLQSDEAQREECLLLCGAADQVDFLI